MIRGSPPNPIDDLSICTETGRAHAFLHYEHHVYLQALEQAQRLQLLLPMEGPGRRFKVVDACVLEETALTGAKKVFLRSDREHTWIGDGFGLMALYRPAVAGTGDDMTPHSEPSLDADGLPGASAVPSVYLDCSIAETR